MMNRLIVTIIVLLLLVSENLAMAQKKEKAGCNRELVKSSRMVNYGVVTVDEIKQDMKSVLIYLEKNTPFCVVNKQNGKIITEYTKMDQNTQLERGAFSLISTEWGAVYSAMLAAAEATGEVDYSDYVYKRFNFLAEVAPHFKTVYEKYGITDSIMIQLLAPRTLEDCGAMCSAMTKAQMTNKDLKLQSLIDDCFNVVMYRTSKLSDGTFSSDRPFRNTLWLDDMFKGIPALALRGRYLAYDQQKYFQEAVRQINQFADRMFVPEKGLFRHGWVESMSEHPAYYWGRANGWAMVTLCEVLDVLPKEHPDRGHLMDLLRQHIKGVAACQGKNGFWHQLSDCNDSYDETLSTALYVCAIAHAINKGWVDATVYGPVALLGWNAISSVINTDGQIEGTCVKTGIGFDPAFYYHRPVSALAAQGYAPVIWAGAEMVNLMKREHPRMNDGAVCFYPTIQRSDLPVFSYSEPGNPLQFVAGLSRLDKKAPVVFVIGDSTVKYRAGNGEYDRWGWGGFLQPFFDISRITVENCAMEGRSSRTYYTEGLWDRLLPAMQKGDYLIIDFGHNDSGPLNTGLARGALKGTDDKSQKVVLERDGSIEEVFSYGHYIRMYIRQAKARGVEVIILSHTPANQWQDGKMRRCNQTYAKWSREVAEQENAYFVDLNDIAAKKFETIGEEKTKSHYMDMVHTSKEGAMINAEAVIEGIRYLEKCRLKNYLKK